MSGCGRGKLLEYFLNNINTVDSASYAVKPKNASLSQPVINDNKTSFRSADIGTINVTPHGRGSLWVNIHHPLAKVTLDKVEGCSSVRKPEPEFTEVYGSLGKLITLIMDSLNF